MYEWPSLKYCIHCRKIFGLSVWFISWYMILNWFALMPPVPAGILTFIDKIVTFISVLWVCTLLNYSIWFSVALIKRALTKSKQIGEFAFLGDLPPGEHDKRWWDGDPFQQPKSSGVTLCSHVLHHGPRRDQAVDRDVARNLVPAGNWRTHQPAQDGWAVSTATWVHKHTPTHAWYVSVNYLLCTRCQLGIESKV